MAITLGVGDLARDSITGFRGVVVAMTYWLNGCVRVTLQPKALHEGVPVEPSTFDVEQVELVKARPTQRRATGGPKPEPSRNPNPS